MVVNSPTVVAPPICIDMGFAPVGSARDVFGAFMRRELVAWQKAVQVSGAKVD